MTEDEAFKSNSLRQDAHDRAPEYAAQHSIAKLADDPALQGELGHQQ